MRNLGIAIVFASAIAAAAPAHAAVWGIKSFAPTDGVTPSSAPANLFSFDEDGNGFADHGAITYLGQQVDADGLAMDTDGTLYAFILGSIDVAPIVVNLALAPGYASQLVTINPTTGVATPVGVSPLTGVDIRGAVIDAAGLLYALDAESNTLNTVSKATGTVIGSVGLTLDSDPFDLHTITDLAIRADGAAFMSSLDTFYSIDLSTGALTQLIAFPPDAIAGLAFSDLADLDETLYAYEVTGTDDLGYVMTDSGFTGDFLIENIIPSFNSGRGDLAGPVSRIVGDDDDDDTPGVPAPAALPAGLALLGLLATRHRR